LEWVEDEMKSWPLIAALTVIAAILIAGASSGPVVPLERQPQYTSDGSMKRPTDYRDWVYVSSGLGMNYVAGGPNGNLPFTPAFTNVFVQPEAYKYFLANGKWPDKTIFALEGYSATSHGSINQSGSYQDSFSGLEANVKDSSKPDGWSFYNFGTDNVAAKAFPRQACLSCHEKNAAVEASFVQFYPTLLDVAIAKGTLKPGYVAPLNSSRLYKLIAEKGWPAAESALAADKQNNPESPLGSEPALNAVGYRLLATKKTAEAVSVLKHVANTNPTSVNAFDSLADAYAASGDKDLELETARRELELANSSNLPQSRRDQYINLATERIQRLQK
jgi:tetratricopeptide (TPR) repeat protein